MPRAPARARALGTALALALATWLLPLAGGAAAWEAALGRDLREKHIVLVACARDARLRQDLVRAFADDAEVISIVSCADCWQHSGTVRFFARAEPDAHCLLEPNAAAEVFGGSAVTVPRADATISCAASVDETLAFINEHAGLARQRNGSLNAIGELALDLHDALETPLQCSEAKAEALSVDDLLHDFVLKQRPIVVRGGASKFLELHGRPMQWRPWEDSDSWDDEVDVKVVPRESPGHGWGRFECTEPLKDWNESQGPIVPDHVKKRLLDASRVLTRPANAVMRLGDFVSKLMTPSASVVEYIEYQHLVKARRPEVAPALAARMPQLRATNMWLSAGNTTSCAHMDAFENFLFQIEGIKRFTILAPGTMEEGYLREAIFEYNETSGTASRTRLMPSTSIVNTAADDPNAVRAHPAALHCEVRAGDMIYLPAHFWHQVDSPASFHSPSESNAKEMQPHNHSFNFALNFWFEPIFSKQFPCTSCQVAPRHGILSSIMAANEQEVA
ncbi:Lysine-specific demethylase 8 [Hondaea fermentalgiana]|uniref:Lysine-specific demethylase 8 n=1 Tax=Hondaea fermentalgiana TaxID=2315210 RepID=A0A2R5GV75_9STRA|nr:Lysine-specific demethylase 8 [Hondaea fermentalgiana]|eukprot:GBG34465.1 Lysine-specific demethylase 8 [Hondaea fermentalgiana]